MRHNLLHSLRLLMAAPLALFLLAGCDSFFGKKTKLDFIVPPQPSGDVVSYVPIYPFITDGLTTPTQVIVGFDNLIYVVDSASQQLFCYDEAGRKQSQMHVPGIIAVAQDRTLDILAVGRDTLSGSGAEKVPVAAIFRIAVKQGVYGLAEGKIVNRVLHPSYLGVRPINANTSQVRFNGIATLPDNTYYVTRSGTGTDALTGQADDAVLLFDRHDRFRTPVSITGEGGATYTDFFKTPYSIATVPPKTYTFPTTDLLDFVVTTINPIQDTVLRVRYVAVSSGDAGTSYNIVQLANGPTSISKGAIYQARRFKNPKGVCVAGDETGFVFLTDKDSLFQFGPNGQEGVKLAASQTNQNLNKVSFGGTGNGPYNFNQPRGIAYLNKTVYVADKGNGRVCRYKLSSDFQ